jgi:hypothetical protein
MSEAERPQKPGDLPSGEYSLTPPSHNRIDDSGDRLKQADLGGEAGTGKFAAPLAGVAEIEDPTARQIALWLAFFAKATKGMRVYSLNNQTMQRYIDDCFHHLEAMFQLIGEVTLQVREDRFLWGKEAVYVNSDRQDGIPYTFYRNAFRRITVVAGMTREEVISLMSAIITDYQHYDYAGEDLVTELWRLSLPHIRYLTIDVMAVDAKAASAEDRGDIERVQEDIEGIVARVYQATLASGDDIVAGVSITKEDLEALKEIRQEDKEDLDLLDVATSRAIADIPLDELQKKIGRLKLENRDSLSRDLIDILVIILFKELSSQESSQTVELIQQLFDSLLVAERYEHAIYLIRRLKDHQAKSEDLKVIHIANHLLRLFSTEARVVPVINAFNDTRKTASVQEMLEFLRILGPPIVPVLLSGLDMLTAPAHRRMICELVLEYGVPDKQLLWEKLQGAKWFVARDILGMALRLPLDQITGMVMFGLKNEHPKVREASVSMLRSYGRGTADRLVAEKLLDPDIEVRLAATRVAAARRSLDAKTTIELTMQREDLADKEPRELRLLMAAYAAISGSDGVAALDRVLNPGFFARSKMTEAQIAAAFALASIGTTQAMAAIQRGLRTLNARVRDACKKALARDFTADTGSLPATADLLAGNRTGSFPMMTDPNAAVVKEKSGDLIPGIKAETTGSLKIPGEGTPATNRSMRAQAIPDDAPDFVVGEVWPADLKQKARLPNVTNSSTHVGRVHGSQPVRDELPKIPIKLPDVEYVPPANPAYEIVPEMPGDPVPMLPLMEPIGADLDGEYLPPHTPPPLQGDLEELLIEAPEIDFDSSFEGALIKGHREELPSMPRFFVPEASTEVASPRPPPERSFDPRRAGVFAPPSPTDPTDPLPTAPSTGPRRTPLHGILQSVITQQNIIPPNTATPARPSPPHGVPPAITPPRPTPPHGIPPAATTQPSPPPKRAVPPYAVTDRMEYPPTFGPEYDLDEPLTQREVPQRPLPPPASTPPRPPPQNIAPPTRPIPPAVTVRQAYPPPAITQPRPPPSAPDLGSRVGKAAPTLDPSLSSPAPTRPIPPAVTEPNPNRERAIPPPSLTPAQALAQRAMLAADPRAIPAAAPTEIMPRPPRPPATDPFKRPLQAPPQSSSQPYGPPPGTYTRSASELISEPIITASESPQDPAASLDPRQFARTVSEVQAVEPAQRPTVPPLPRTPSLAKLEEDWAASFPPSPGDPEVGSWAADLTLDPPRPSPPKKR